MKNQTDEGHPPVMEGGYPVQSCQSPRNIEQLYLKFSEQDQSENVCEQYMVKDCKEGA